jgi:hypothetical protein
MAAEVNEGIGKGRALLLGLLVVVAVVGAICFAGSSGEGPKMPDEFVDEDVVEVSPMVPAGNLSNASWRTAEQIREDRAADEADEEANGGESVFENVEWAEDDHRRAYDKSVEETVREIDGLGVYVAPVEEAKKPAKKQGK